MDAEAEVSPPNILVVCTANRCRSPLGEVLLQAALRRIGRDAVVSSAGFMDDGIRAEAESVEAAARVGLSLAGHRSRRLTREIIDNADLILTMERSHVREIAVRYRAFAKTFTIKEFERRANDSPAQREELFDEWVARVHLGRTTADLMGTSAEDEIADPLGQPLAAFIKTREELDASLTTIARVFP